jgi:ribonuclease HIII
LSATFVAKLAREAGERLYKELGRGPYQFRSVAHAHWAAQGEDVTVVWYRSGKLVVQGKGLEVFADRHRALLGAAAAPPGDPHARAPSGLSPWAGPTVGSDESGKGDYFGPLAVAAALVRPDQADLLTRLAIVDSKLAGDTRIRTAEGALVKELVTAERVLMPEVYNAEWEKVRNVNVLLGRLHAEVLAEVLAKSKTSTGCRIVVDKFGDPSHVRKHLPPSACALEFAMITGGEREPAVAAASFLARAAFLRGLEQLQSDAPVTLPLGASDPRILTAGRALLREGGRPWLGKFAKLHFKTTENL